MYVYIKEQRLLAFLCPCLDVSLTTSKSLNQKKQVFLTKQ